MAVGVQTKTVDTKRGTAKLGKRWKNRNAESGRWKKSKESKVKGEQWPLGFGPRQFARGWAVRPRLECWSWRVAKKNVDECRRLAGKTVCKGMSSDTEVGASKGWKKWRNTFPWFLRISDWYIQSLVQARGWLSSPLLRLMLVDVYCRKTLVQKLWFRTSNRWIRSGIEHGACWGDFSASTLHQPFPCYLFCLYRKSFGRFRRWMCKDLCSMWSFTLNQLRMSVAWEGLWLVEYRIGRFSNSWCTCWQRTTVSSSSWLYVWWNSWHFV